MTVAGYSLPQMSDDWQDTDFDEPELAWVPPDVDVSDPDVFTLLQAAKARVDSSRSIVVITILRAGSMFFSDSHSGGCTLGAGWKLARLL